LDKAAAALATESGPVTRRDRCAAGSSGILTEHARLRLSRVITAIQPNFLAVTQSCLIIWTTRWVQGCGVGVLATSTGAVGHR
jgi:hypothetical protein